MREWKAAYEKLASVVKVVKPVTLLSVNESTDHSKRDINDAFCESHGPLFSYNRLTTLQDARFKDLIETYLKGVDNTKVHTLEDIVKFNEEHADQELPPSRLPDAISARQNVN